MKAIAEFIAAVLFLATGLGGGPALGYYVALHGFWYLGLLVALVVVGIGVVLASWMWDALTPEDVPDSHRAAH